MRTEKSHRFLARCCHSMTVVVGYKKKGSHVEDIFAIWSTTAMPQFVELQYKSQKAGLSNTTQGPLATSPRETCVSRWSQGLDVVFSLRQCLTVLWHPGTRVVLLLTKYGESSLLTTPPPSFQTPPPMSHPTDLQRISRLIFTQISSVRVIPTILLA